jgi:hypothetical protein
MSLLSAIAETGASLRPQLGRLASRTIKRALFAFHAPISRRDRGAPRFKISRAFARQVLADTQIPGRLPRAPKAR